MARRCTRWAFLSISSTPHLGRALTTRGLKAHRRARRRAHTHAQARGLPHARSVARRAPLLRRRARHRPALVHRRAAARRACAVARAARCVRARSISAPARAASRYCSRSRFPHARIDAADISGDALEVARRNVADYRLERRVKLVRSDLYRCAATAALRSDRFEPAVRERRGDAEPSCRIPARACARAGGRARRPRPREDDRRASAGASQ